MNCVIAVEHTTDRLPALKLRRNIVGRLACGADDWRAAGAGRGCTEKLHGVKLGVELGDAAIEPAMTSAAAADAEQIGLLLTEPKFIGHDQVPLRLQNAFSPL